MEFKVWICEDIVKVLDHLILVAVLVSIDPGRDIDLGNT